jgi:drug/metabolite transporter (DMT)-like permease
VTALAMGVNPFGDGEVNRWFLIARGSSGAISLASYFFTLTHMPLGDGTTLFFINPCLVALAAFLVLREPMSKMDMAAMVLCLVGVVFVSQPSFIFGGASKTSLIPTAVALFGASMTSVAYCLVRFMGKRVHFLCHVFYFGMASTFLSAVL